MIFGPTPLDQAVGALLAHSVKLGRGSFKKGRRLSAEDVEQLRAAGLESVIAARLEAGDCHEDEAAASLAQAVMGENLKASAAFTGRCNLIAKARGVLLVERARLDAINGIDESVTLATLPPFELVEPRQMVATVKIIPFAVEKSALERCLEAARGATALVRLAALRPRQVGLVQTHLPGMKASILDKTLEALALRLAALDCPPPLERRCTHDPAEIARALDDLAQAGCALLLVSGASAIVDRRDVVPEGIVASGGVIEHFGMPVDPGNLMLLAHRAETPVLGLPGCARSPKVNGFDWVLQRLLADVPVAPSDIMAMGAGGLLKEIALRPLPRSAAVERAPAAPRAPRIAALVLAAGQSRRMGKRNKLLAKVEGKTMVRRAAEAALASQAASVVLVTGHERAGVEAALQDLELTCVHNPDYTQGLSTSLHRGLAALSADIDGALIMLADMPRIDSAMLDRLIAAFNPAEGRAICLPTHQGKRGNPVLFARRFFAEMQAVSGDVGARHLLGEYPELVCEVAMDDEAVLTDIDTPEALAALEGAR